MESSTTTGFGSGLGVQGFHGITISVKAAAAAFVTDTTMLCAVLLLLMPTTWCAARRPADPGMRGAPRLMRAGPAAADPLPRHMHGARPPATTAWLLLPSSWGGTLKCPR